MCEDMTVVLYCISEFKEELIAFCSLRYMLHASGVWFII